MKQLTVEKAAIRDDNGEIWSVERPGRHWNIIHKMRAEGYEGNVNGIDQQGFLLNDGRFVNRRQALLIAKRAGQLKNGKSIGGSQLLSEDVW